MIKPLDLAELRRIAEAATPGEWTARYERAGKYGGGDDWHIDAAPPLGCVSCGLSDFTGEADARHIATFNPATVLALLDRIAELEARRDELLALVARISQETPLPDEVRTAVETRGALLAEIGTLRAEVRARDERIAQLEAERDVTDQKPPIGPVSAQ
jgi:predicted  nucleic acid-binding Zn-ribbon protein